MPLIDITQDVIDKKVNIENLDNETDDIVYEQSNKLVILLNNINEFESNIQIFLVKYYNHRMIQEYQSIFKLWETYVNFNYNIEIDVDYYNKLDIGDFISTNENISNDYYIKDILNIDDADEILKSIEQNKIIQKEANDNIIKSYNDLSMINKLILNLETIISKLK